MEAKLIVVGGDVKASEIKLKLPTIIGRGQGASLLLRHPLVSRQHCEIYEHEGQLVVRDMGSLNGTFINQTRLTEPTILPSGDLLTIGTVTFRAEYESDANARPPASGATERLTGLPTSQAVKSPAAAPPAPAEEEDLADFGAVEEVEEVAEFDQISDEEEIAPPAASAPRALAPKQDDDFVDDMMAALEDVEEVEEIDEVEEAPPPPAPKPAAAPPPKSVAPPAKSGGRWAMPTAEENETLRAPGRKPGKPDTPGQPGGASRPEASGSQATERGTPAPLAELPGSEQASSADEPATAGSEPIDEAAAFLAALGMRDSREDESQTPAPVEELSEAAEEAESSASAPSAETAWPPPEPAEEAESFQLVDEPEPELNFGLADEGTEVAPPPVSEAVEAVNVPTPMEAGAPVPPDVKEEIASQDESDLVEDFDLVEEAAAELPAIDEAEASGLNIPTPMEAGAPLPPDIQEEIAASEPAVELPPAQGDDALPPLADESDDFGADILGEVPTPMEAGAPSLSDIHRELAPQPQASEDHAAEAEDELTLDWPDEEPVVPPPTPMEAGAPVPESAVEAAETLEPLAVEAVDEQAAEDVALDLPSEEAPGVPTPMEAGTPAPLDAVEAAEELAQDPEEEVSIAPPPAPPAAESGFAFAEPVREPEVPAAEAEQPSTSDDDIASFLQGLASEPVAPVAETPVAEETHDEPSLPTEAAPAEVDELDLEMDVVDVAEEEFSIDAISSEEPAAESQAAEPAEISDSLESEEAPQTSDASPAFPWGAGVSTSETSEATPEPAEIEPTPVAETAPEPEVQVRPAHAAPRFPFALCARRGSPPKLPPRNAAEPAIVADAAPAEVMESEPEEPVEAQVSDAEPSLSESSAPFNWMAPTEESPDVAMEEPEPAEVEADVADPSPASELPGLFTPTAEEEAEEVDLSLDLDDESLATGDIEEAVDVGEPAAEEQAEDEMRFDVEPSEEPAVAESEEMQSPPASDAPPADEPTAEEPPTDEAKADKSDKPGEESTGDDDLDAFLRSLK